MTDRWTDRHKTYIRASNSPTAANENYWKCLTFMLQIPYELNNEVASITPLQDEDHRYKDFELFCTLINTASHSQKSDFDSDSCLDYMYA